MTVYGSRSNDLIYMNLQAAGHAGFDTIYAVGGFVYTSASALGDDVFGGNSFTTIHGETGTGTQYLFLGSGGGTVFGGAGNDLISGGISTVTLHAGSGNQTIDSGFGANDQIFAGAGTDTIYVESANATVTNSSGNDTISFSASGGTVRLGFGGTTIYGGTGTGGLTVINPNGPTGNATIFAGNGTGNNITGGSGSGTNILFGGTSADVVHGGDFAGTNDIFGYLGNDILYGGVQAFDEFLNPQLINNYFNLTYDIHAGDADDIANWRNSATYHDWIFLPAAVQGATNFYPTGTDVVGYVAIGTGYYGMYINNASLADVTAHVFYS